MERVIKGGIRNWLWGWYETLRIMLFERETYRYIRDCERDPMREAERRSSEARWGKGN